MIPASWRRVSKLEPCPICSKPDWCCVGVRYVNCMRVESDKVCTNGGWLHSTGDTTKPLPPKRQTEPEVDVWPLYMKWAINFARLDVLGRLLGIDPAALKKLNVVWSVEHQAWAFPMVDVNGKITGIRLRNEHGHKWAVKGGRNGLFVPTVEPQSRCIICEGPTDTAALLSIGLFAIGRPSCNEGTAALCTMLPKLGVRSAVIACDHDDDKERFDGQNYNPGVDGSKRLAERLPVPNVIWIPPTKDAREFVKLGGTAMQIEAMIKCMKWNQPE